MRGTDEMSSKTGDTLRMRLQATDKRAGFRCWTGLALALLMVILPACRPKGKAAAGAARGQSTFATPEDAGKALVDAAKNNNQDQLLSLFGPDAKDVIFSGDAARDKASFTQFASAYGRMNRWRELEGGIKILLVGVSNTAFPIPLRKDTSGKWFFDTAAGKGELTNRDLGRNELANVDVIAMLRIAQMEYFEQAHDGGKQYARKFISDPGKQDGLYWPEQPGKPKSPIGPLLAYATPEGARVQSSLHKPFYGYYYGILYTQGPFAHGGLRDYSRDGVMNRGFGFVAYPAKYGETGVMTFIIDEDGTIFQKDMGTTTDGEAPFMRQFNPDGTWSEVTQ
jgi:hypothetical protein